MPLYNVEPCPKCGRNVWRLIEIDRRTEVVLFSCLYDGTELRKGGEDRCWGCGGVVEVEAANNIYCVACLEKA